MPCAFEDSHHTIVLRNPIFIYIVLENVTNMRMISFILLRYTIPGKFEFQDYAIYCFPRVKNVKKTPISKMLF